MPAVLPRLSELLKKRWPSLKKKYEWDKRPWQEPAVEFAAHRLINGGGCALFCEQGTGKTYITLALIELLSPESVLIVAPLTAVNVTWAPRLEGLGYSIARTLAGYRQMTGKRVLLINYEGIQRPKAVAKVAKVDWGLVVFDESQGLKARGSKNSRAARRLRFAHRRLILSGTPLDSSQMDVWAQMRFVDCNIFGERWADFEDEYVERYGFMNYKRRFRADKHDKFMAKIKPCSYRVSKEVLGLRQTNIIEVPVILLGKQRRIYDQMAQHSIVKEGDFKVKAGLTITQNIKLHQITSGFLTNEDEEMIRVGIAKERKLRWLIRRVGLPVVVFCKYRREMVDVYRILTEELDRVTTLHGDKKDKKNNPQRTEIVRKFQNGELDGLVCQVRTGGVSISFTRSCNLIFYSVGYSYIDWEQIISRFERDGQESQVNVFLMFAQDTIDEEPIIAIGNKRKMSSLVMDPLTER